MKTEGGLFFCRKGIHVTSSSSSSSSSFLSPQATFSKENKQKPDTFFPPFFSLLAKSEGRRGEKRGGKRRKTARLWHFLGDKGRGSNSICFSITCLFIYWWACVKGPQPIHKIAGYKVLLQSLLPRSLHSFGIRNPGLTHRCGLERPLLKDDRVCHALLPWHRLFSWLLFLTSKSRWKEPTTMLIFRKFLSLALSFPNSSQNLFSPNCSTYEFPYLDTWKRKYSPHVLFLFWWLIICCRTYYCAGMVGGEWEQ